MDEAIESYRQAASALLSGLDDAVVPWIERIASERLGNKTSDQVHVVAASIHAEVMPKLRRLFNADVNAQSAGPLGVLRAAVGPANALLAAEGVTPPERDPVAASMFPEDIYDLSPANFDDVDPSLHDPGIVWGAAKAHLFLARHRH